MTSAPRRPAGSSLPTDPGVRAPEPLTGAVHVLCDGPAASRLGPLSYLVPAGMTVRAGDAVTVPFGTRTVYGMVLGPGEDGKATRPLAEVHGMRAAVSDIKLAHALATYHFSTVGQVMSRLAPTTGRGADPITDEPATLAEDAPRVRYQPPTQPRALLVPAPLVDRAALAAAEALRLSARGQVLVLCPTAADVTRVRAHFATGAQRLDSRAPAGAWKGFLHGTVAVGIGTRTAALFSARHLAGIVVLDEEHPGHLEARQPHTHARDVASARSRTLRIALTLISTNPSPQALGAGVAWHPVGQRTDWPAMHLVNRASLDPAVRWAPPVLQGHITRAVKAGHTPLVVVQRGASVRRCRRCRTPIPCTECDSSLCRHPQHGPCATCAQDAGVWMSGWDADRVAGLLGPAVRTVTLADLPKHRNAGLVVLFDVDAARAVPELVPDTHLTHVVLTAAAAAGRGGSVVALSDDAQAPALATLFGPRDLLPVLKDRLACAKAAQLPPFGRLVTVRTGHKSAPSVHGWPGQVLGPRRVGPEWETLVRIPAADLLTLAPHLEKVRKRGKARVTVS